MAKKEKSTSLNRLPFRLRPGNHVHLSEFEDQPAQCGEYVGISCPGIAMVRVCPQWREAGDDGYREVTYDQLENFPIDRRSIGKSSKKEKVV